MDNEYNYLTRRLQDTLRCCQFDIAAQGCQLDLLDVQGVAQIMSWQGQRGKIVAPSHAGASR